MTEQNAPETAAQNENPSAPTLDPNPMNEVPEPPAEPSKEELELFGKIEECLMDVIDPELGINVVDLGLVYDTWAEGSTAVVNMTLTSPACPLTDMIEDQANSAVVGTLQEITDLRINWVWSPAWGPHMINEEGREQLRYLGFSV
ncbi:metal-sulfur cluster assembly factor [Corynebacterium suicordis]|uniref:metal-sulfur cluster assembly factor n=1 Tax=uncultured Corynebacterium sp. TaxID=159447 RepID=UPI002595C80F|nr:metal-sulfur cluster assembly factor [uncultured Corynebacterium sp.]